ncbi:LysR substrate-binding domain-containing protein [Sphingomonas crocodyli]|uniref:LysR family transcriptional regulator n=1 Tax=Sphingomonas crocodyli TaxID=1979270 RepID=A0A437M015_9SPHN|nr:LysR substrate-binding domain-containing protein [Sphingomonas crocodyli]RVT91039.1 LysR family transcriptional regulator [Sphingomonas crocodyli]
MELRHLRYFVGVAEELHFGRAATRLGISQPPLSQQIRALEDELGVALFERTSRRVTLTEAGTLFLTEARRVLDQADHAIDVARRAQRGELGELSVGFSASVPFNAVVANALSSFREAFPAVRLNLAEMPRGEQLERLREERLDVGFIRGLGEPPITPMMVATPLFDEPLMLAMRSDHPLATRRRAPSIADLRDEAFVLYGSDHGAGFNEHLDELCAKAGFTPRVVQEAAGLTTLLGLVAVGMGITVITRSLAALHPDNIIFRELAGQQVLSSLWLVRRRNLSTAARRFVDLVETGHATHRGD